MVLILLAPAVYGAVAEGEPDRNDAGEREAHYGDMVHDNGLNGHAYQFNHPSLTQELLTENEGHNRRVLTMQRARGFLGDGLLTSEEPLHTRQRRLAPG